MKRPSGRYILELLIKLYAEQEGLEIDYQIVRGDEVLAVGNSKQKHISKDDWVEIA